MKLRVLPVLAAACLLCGCASILDREYHSIEPHSRRFWESEAAGTLRAENYQDVVNDLMLLIADHRDQAVIRLYNYQDDLAVSDALEQAAKEVQQETPLGNYAVEYITSSSTAQRNYYDLDIQISYRRTAEQLQSIVNATSASALSSLLEAALDAGKTELAVRLGYWNEADRETVRQMAAELRESWEIPPEQTWLIVYYPQQGPVGLIEFLLEPSEELLAERLAETFQADEITGMSGEDEDAAEDSGEITDGGPPEGENSDDGGEAPDNGKADAENLSDKTDG